MPDPVFTASPEAKPQLRARMRAVRRAMASGPIAFPEALGEALARPGIIASYLPVDGEADPAAIVAAAVARGWRIALPHITSRAAPMRFLGWAPGEPLVPAPFGLSQPSADAPVVEPGLILTPLVAFDARGHRLGQGAGHYDRAFAALPDARRWGVAWACQQVAAVPVDRWDVPLDGVITEAGWLAGATR